MALQNIQSYMLVFMQDDGPGHYRPGMVVDVRDISRPLGKLETMPKFSVVYSDLPVEDLSSLLEQDDDEVLVDGEVKKTFVNKRRAFLDVGNALVFPNIASGAEELPAEKLSDARVDIQRERLVVEDLAKAIIK